MKIPYDESYLIHKVVANIELLTKYCFKEQFSMNLSNCLKTTKKYHLMNLTI